MYECFCCMYVYHFCEVSTEARRWHQISWNRQFWASMWVLGIESRYYGRTVKPSLQPSIIFKNIQKLRIYDSTLKPLAVFPKKVSCFFINYFSKHTKIMGYDISHTCCSLLSCPPPPFLSLSSSLTERVLGERCSEWDSLTQSVSVLLPSFSALHIFSGQWLRQFGKTSINRGCIILEN